MKIATFTTPVINDIPLDLEGKLVHITFLWAQPAVELLFQTEDQ
ncbi:MAG: hypothetical protein ACRCXZ_07770 [Patescibacteria group bacterium]